MNDSFTEFCAGIWKKKKKQVKKLIISSLIPSQFSLNKVCIPHYSRQTSKNCSMMCSCLSPKSEQILFSIFSILLGLMNGKNYCIYPISLAIRQAFSLPKMTTNN